MNYNETYFELDSEEATHCYHCHLICIKGHVETVDAKDQSNAIMYGMFVDTVDTKIEACKCIEFYVCRTLSILVFVTPTQHCIQSNDGVKTLLCIQWPKLYVDTVNTKHIHTFLPITFLIFNRFSIRKKFWKAETQGFSTIPSILYMSILSIQDKDP